MTNFIVKIAECVIEISAIFDTTRIFCKDYWSYETPDFSVEITKEDIAFERAKSEQEDRIEGHPVRIFLDNYLETIAVQRKIAEKLFDYDTLLFHGSVVSVNGRGYLFTAKSGTGKSTHTKLWCQVLGKQAVMVNDDKPFLKISKDGVLVYGSPWNGKHNEGNNICVPLHSICILERGENNCIEKIEGKDALFMLFQQSNRPMQPNKMIGYMGLIDKLLSNIDFYTMKCNMHTDAAIMAYETMSAKREKRGEQECE